MKTQDYFTKNNILWFPINLEVEGKKKNLLPYNETGSRPNMNDFENIKKVNKRLTYKNYEYGAVDTRYFQHIDVDIKPTEEYSEDTLKYVEDLKSKIPYFNSVTKKNPHFIIKNDNLGDSYRIQTNHKDIEILNKQWGYFKLNDIMINSDKEITPIDKDIIADINEENIIKHKATKKTKIINENPIKEELTASEISILNNINTDYWTNYDSWRKLMIILYHKTKDISICIKYSKKGDNYGGEEAIKKVINNKNHFTFGTVNYYSKLSNETEYYKIKSKYNPKLKDTTDTKMAEYYLNIIGDDIAKQDDELYIYLNPFWKLDIKKDLIRKNMIDILYKIFDNQLNELKTEYDKQNKKILLKEIEDTEKDLELDKIKAQYSKDYQFIKKAITSIHTSSKQRAIMEQITILLNNEDYKFDRKRPELFSFKNKTFNLKTKKEEEINKYDYITLNTGYDYIEPTKEQTNKINKFLTEILPNEEVLKCALSVLRKGFYGQQDEYFVLFNGEGGNGKGVLLELYKELSGSYYYDGHDSLLCSKTKTGANPELANSHLKRSIVFSEPDEGTKLNASVIKQFTGNPIINARGLYSSRTETHIHATTILQCNQRPKITGNCDNAIIRRLIDILFPVNFVSSENDLIENNDFVKLKDLSFKDIDFKENHKIALFNIIFNSEKEEIYIPPIVEMRGKKFLFDNDDLLTWFNELYELTNDKTHYIKLTDLYDQFKNSDTFRDFSKEKRSAEWTKSKFIEKIQCNISLKKHNKDRIKINGKSLRNVLINYKYKGNINSDFESDNE